MACSCDKQLFNGSLYCSPDCQNPTLDFSHACASSQPSSPRMKYRFSITGGPLYANEYYSSRPSSPFPPCSESECANNSRCGGCGGCGGCYCHCDDTVADDATPDIFNGHRRHPSSMDDFDESCDYCSSTAPLPIPHRPRDSDENEKKVHKGTFGEDKPI